MNMVQLTAIDFKRLAEIAQNDMSEFERERSRIIRAHIESLPEERRKAAYAFQLELDLKRLHLSGSDFMTYCIAKITDNMDQLQTLAQSLGMTMVESISGKSSQLPANVIQFPRT
jgi:Protein of unknown function (DUF3135)